eukprot:c10080_g1_i1.p1 GENE.c10080_g1_i1~~c10080_g1_i1.p1  ORF type:complete len:282 (+),score=74.30 c10080_g1_i1:44-847(+)
MMNDTELSNIALRGFGEALAAIARSSSGTDAVLSTPDLLGHKVDPNFAETLAFTNPFYHGAVVLPGRTAPTQDDPQLPFCIWTSQVGVEIPGRMLIPELEGVIMTLDLANFHFDPENYDDCNGSKNAAGQDITLLATPSLQDVAEINERAYGQIGGTAPLVDSMKNKKFLQDARIQTYGLVDAADKTRFVCVCFVISVDDDVNFHFVATEESHRRKGLATFLMQNVLLAAKKEGKKTASLQASKDGLSVYKKLGFRSLGIMNGYLKV